MTDHRTSARVEADPSVPIIRITRDFAAPRDRVLKAHLDPDLFARWVGPDDVTTRIDYWDARRGGRWRFTNLRGDEEYAFYGSFHEITDDRIVQTFTWEGQPQGVSLETLTLADLGDGWTRITVSSLVDSFESRDAWLASGMEGGLNDGYAKLDAMLAAGVPALVGKGVPQG